MEKPMRRTRRRDAGAPNSLDETVGLSSAANRLQAEEDVPVYGPEYADDVPAERFVRALDFEELDDSYRVSDTAQALDGAPSETGKPHRFVKPQRFHFDPVRRRFADDDSPNPALPRKWPLYVAVTVTALLVFVSINVEQSREESEHWAAPEASGINESLVSREVMNPSADLPTRVPQAFWEKQVAEFAVTEELPTPTPFVTEPPVVNTPAPTAMPLLKKGMQGDFIRTVQERLVELNYLAPDQVDGKYEASTVAAVKDFQINSYLKADGMAGRETYDALMAVSAVVAPTPTPRLNEPYVWATVNGTYYHTKPDCRNMKGAAEIPISEAKFMKKKPCNRCDAPQ